MQAHQAIDVRERSKQLTLPYFLSGSVGRVAVEPPLGARHEPLNDFCREQMHADVVSWLDGHLERKMSEERKMIVQ
jgi:alpha-beta hydrolase superfamily lysophospholipase